MAINDIRQVQNLLKRIRNCEVCSSHLPEGPRPIVQASEKSKIAIIGQAPGSKVHATGIPWDDPSGKRLRTWLGVSEEQFYDADIFCLLPMGFCYPGRGKSGDLPPRPECAPLWHDEVLNRMPNIKLSLLIGQYAQKRYLGTRAKTSLTETVKNYKEYFPEFLPLVHPSPRNAIWQKKNPWFDAEIIPAIQKIVSDSL